MIRCNWTRLSLSKGIRDSESTREQQLWLPREKETALAYGGVVCDARAGRVVGGGVGEGAVGDTYNII